LGETPNKAGLPGARLRAFANPYPTVEVLRRVLRGAGRDRVAAHRMHSANRVTVDELTERCEEINRLELKTEDQVREMVRELFANERDPIVLMKHHNG
jgi:hypothetical protein